ncbi:hypothetical protein [Beijerinckia sp. L45]|uniref:hypothetical protein n=1 Tax=Beijerinckia sp. L45 TaxID=1641855 RepID=UPI00131EA817|nr:hypothetical protein [Beijerinckia sp. L45]
MTAQPAPTAQDNQHEYLNGIAEIAVAAGLTKAEVKALGKAGRLPLSRARDGSLYATRKAIDAWRAENH